MNIYVVNHNLNIGDKIAVFSGDKCVGVNSVDSDFVSIVCSMDDGTGNGFLNGDTIIFKTTAGNNISVRYYDELEFCTADGRFDALGSAFLDLYCDYGIITTIDREKVNNSGKSRYFTILGQEINETDLQYNLIYIEIQNGESRKILRTK